MSPAGHCAPDGEHWPCASASTRPQPTQRNDIYGKSFMLTIITHSQFEEQSGFVSSLFDILQAEQDASVRLASTFLLVVTTRRLRC